MSLMSYILYHNQTTIRNIWNGNTYSICDSLENMESLHKTDRVPDI